MLLEIVIGFQYYFISICITDLVSLNDLKFRKTVHVNTFIILRDDDLAVIEALSRFLMLGSIFLGGKTTT